MAGVVVGNVVLAATGPVINIRTIQGHINNKNTHFFFFHPRANVGEVASWGEIRKRRRWSNVTMVPVKVYHAPTQRRNRRATPGPRHLFGAATVVLAVFLLLWGVRQCHKLWPPLTMISRPRAQPANVHDARASADVPRADVLPPLPPRYRPPVHHVVSPGCAPDATRFGCSRLARSIVSMHTSSSDNPTQPDRGLCSATNRDHVNSEAMTKATAMTKDQGSGGNDDTDGLAAKTWQQRNHTSDYDDHETKTTTSTTATTLTTRQH
ncbi:hypothetical protein EDB89DRAFT_1917631 [Lactarius sanguifluus]|nr:hypothetical protein EDB89DRAFT_1917631 [Lactarius sanguifluus]